ncbi:unnamed protein product [Brassica napus]|uniref:(rape) hypothetical protein n=1 Tax=Brassica napus TaxID=3708 RepID=A0A816UPI3_BRANA|nr:unnamed protein product [Brassica napus]
MTNVLRRYLSCLQVPCGTVVVIPRKYCIRSRISNVEILHLSPGSADVISRCVEDGLVLPVFKNLVKLYFGSNNKRGWKLLPYLIKQTPKLETLIIQGLEGYAGNATIRPFQVKVDELLKRWIT